MFLSLFKASEDRSPFGDFWFTPVGNASLSGVRVTPDSAMQVTAVYGCVKVLAESLAILPPILYERKGDKKVIITNHWLHKLLNKRPNRYQNAYQWREMLQGHLAIRGNAYNEIIANARGEIIELLPINPDAIKVQIKTDGSYNYRITYQDGSLQIKERGEIWHLKGLAPDIYQGYNPIQIARDSIGTALSAQSYGAKFFANDAKPSGGWIENPGSFKDTEAKRIFRQSWQEQQGGANRGKTAILDNGMKYHEIGVNNTDAQFLETRKFSVEDIARIFGVPPHRIGHLERSTYNNIEHQGLEFVMYTMAPWAERWEAAIEFDLIPEDSGLEVEHDFTRLLRGDSKARASYYHSLVLDGIMTRNEARIYENLDPIDGLDEPLVPLNMVTISQLNEEEVEEEVDEEETDDNK